MRKVDFAELLLGLSTTMDRAASIAGDLLEHSKTRPGYVFWLDVIRTSASQTWGQLADSPGSILSMALRTYSFDLVATVLGWIGLSVLVTMVRAFFYSGGLMAAGWWISLTLAVLIYIVIPFVVGCWIGRRYPGREVATSFVLLAINIARNIIVAIVFWEIAHHMAGMHLVWSLAGINLTGPRPGQWSLIAVTSPLVFLVWYWPMWIVGAMIERSYSFRQGEASES
jgi:hypothetical protein